MVICKQCGGSFKFDESFLRSISVRSGSAFIPVSAPSFCPDCRNQRRQMFRNDRTFYSRKCDLTGEAFISMYPADAPYKIFRPSAWYGDKWNALDYGRDFDFNKTFFEQFAELQKIVPRLGIDIVNCENSEYCNYCGDDKDCYLDIAGEANRDCYYDLFTKFSNNVVDSTFVYHSELCYECINCYDCYGCQFSQYLENCSECLYCYDLIGCKNCLFSHGLRNKQYVIFNEQKTREEYEKYFANLVLGSFIQRKKIMDGWTKFKKDNVIFRAAYILNSENCSGNDIKNSKNTHRSFNVLNCEDSVYLYDVLDAKNCQDLNYSLYNPELSYELISTLAMVKSAFCTASHYCNEVYYCDLTNNSKNLFGCIGLNHAQYCILNKQYPREEYEEILPKVIDHMIKTGEWGEFFPEWLSPHAYNETVAQEYFPINQSEAQRNGWRWKEGLGGPIGQEEMQIPDNIKDVPVDLAGHALKSEVDGRLFKVISQELKFYQRMELPVPHRSPQIRHLDRLDLRTPRKLWERGCTKCGRKITSVYRSERKEKVYCDECYKLEVY